MKTQRGLYVFIQDEGWVVRFESKIFTNRTRAITYNVKKRSITIGCRSERVETWLDERAVLRVLRSESISRMRDDGLDGYACRYSNNTLANGEALVKALVAYGKTLPKIPKLPKPPKSPVLKYTVLPAKAKKKVTKKR